MTSLVEPNSKPQAVHATGPASAPPRIEVARPVVLAARGLRKAFGGEVVLDGVDLELREGEVILLRGDNGSGKTTLINILTGNLEPDAGSIHYLADGTPREFHFPRRWWQELNPFDHFTPESTAQEGIGRMWQDVRLFHSQTLRDNIAVAEPRHLGENPVRAIFTPGRCRQEEAEISRRADQMLARLGLAGRETSSGDKISLGQSKRVAIARAVAAGARILFLDEPLAGLDRQGIRDVLSLLESIARDHAVTLVIVEHVFNHPHLHGVVTAEWLLEAGVLRANGASNSSVQASNPFSGQSSRRLPWTSLITSDADEVLDEPLCNGAVLTRVRRPTSHTHRQAVLQVRDLLVKRGPRTAVGLDDSGEPSGFNLEVFEDEIAILQAPNGWGKSTLLEAVVGTIPIAHGSIMHAGKAIHGLPLWERSRLGISALLSRAHCFDNLSVSDTLKLAGSSTENMLPLAHLHARRVSSLSGGERQRLSWATMRSAKLSIYDEPLAALDETNLVALCKRLIPEPKSASLILVPLTPS